MDHKRLDLPRWNERHLRFAIEGAGVALWAWNVDTDKLLLDQRSYDMWGVPSTKNVTFEDLSSHIYPADRDRVRAAFAASRAVVGQYEIDFRILIGEEVRWVSARGQGEDDGMVERTMFGIFLDVTGRKQAEESNELLAGEMSHRVKNLLAIASDLSPATPKLMPCWATSFPYCWHLTTTWVRSVVVFAFLFPGWALERRRQRHLR